MNSVMSQEESYADRRKLFKNIWDTAMTLGEKDAHDVVSKPKVIKTLRLDEVDRCLVGKKKKQRLKNLRAVCNKLLDFCDRQDADDLFYEQMAAEGKDVVVREPEPTIQIKKPKPKAKKKTMKSRSVFARVATPTAPKTSASERQGDFSRRENLPSSGNNTPTRQSINYRPRPNLSNDHQLENVRKDRQVNHRLVRNKARQKGKLTSIVKVTQPIPIAKASKKLLQMHKINIT